MTERNKLQSIGLLPFNIIMSIMLTYLMQGIAEISASTFALLWHMLSILIGFFLIFSSKHWILIFVVLPIWVMIHNPLVPRSFDQMNKMGSIVDSNSCGLLSEATLIETDEGVIKGKGSGQIGDYVMLRTTSNFGVSEVVFEVVQPNRYKSWLCDMARNLRQYMQRNLLRYRSIDRDWLRSFVLGEPLKIDSITQNALREFGLLHVVVLSGGHLSILSALVFSLLRFGFVLLYIARIVSARTWSYIWLLSLLLSIILIFAFCAGVGFSSSVQRAFLLFVLISTVDNFWGPIDRIDLYWKIWILQVVLFPIDIFNTSTYLSWCGSLILGSTLRPSKEPSFISEMFLNFKTQIWFCFLSAIVFSSINLWSILANVFLLP
ncbi:MAG: ComEC/Rec2 family competence protein, partial [Proteobacteria bacterium]|nr:ComEC/Rec2 family competence protein [Pseudomonadota bacterium]